MQVYGGQTRAPVTPLEENTTLYDGKRHIAAGALHRATICFAHPIAQVLPLYGVKRKAANFNGRQGNGDRDRN